MITKLITEKDGEKGLDEAARLLKDGELVAIPTETVYGLAANALDGNAVKNIFVAKGRPQDNPLIVHIAEIDEILPLVKNFDERARALAEAYWPGPLTMILPKSDIIPNEVCAGLDTVAIRMPSHPIAHEIIKKCGFPLAAPSANTSGKPSPTTAAHVMNDMNGKIAAVVDGGSCSVGVESTVVTLACPVPRVLRPGGVTPDQLRAVLGEVEIDKAVFKALESGEKVLSPGMKYKHYSPNAHVIIVKGDFDKFASLVAEPRSERTCAVCFDGEEDKISVPAYPYGHADSPEEQARELARNLTRIGKIELPEISPILGSEKTQFYRNKLEYTFSNKRWLTTEEVQQNVVYEQMNAVGFHIPNAFDKVLAIEKCWLQDDISNRIRNAVRDYAYQHNYSFINLRTHEGMLRNMIVRTSTTGELMVILICKIEKEEEMALFKQMLQYIADTFPEITSLLYIINNKCNDTITDLEVHTFKGKDHIFEEMEGLRFKVGPKSFYQTNSEQAYNLYKVARNFAGLTGNELVYDLYTGTGTIANFVSKHARQVIGIEYVPEAIEDAKVNAEINGIKNTLFFAGDMKDMLTQDFINQYGRPDVIITDPPRAGMHQDVVDVILFAEPKRIVYVSCNPATQARDLQLLDAKYKVKAVQPVDMFPHTHHVENVVLLELKD